jgi:hypothetical protein
MSGLCSRGIDVSISSFLRFSALSVLLLGSSLAAAQQVQPRPLITNPINESQVITLRGNVHPLAQPMFDVGAAPPDLPMNRMLLVLKRDPIQDYVVRKLIDDQQDKTSPNYHKWLTPTQFGAQFGAADQDVRLITDWLLTHGFQINRVSNGRTVIEFSGVEAQVEQAFHTQIHQYALPNGEQHWANASDPQIPAALAPAVAGIQALNNFKAQHFANVAGVVSRDKSTGQYNSSSPLFTLTGNCGVQSHCYGVGPYDFAKIYNIAPSWSATPAIDGTGQTIAIVGETDINPQDVADFRNFFGLPAYGQQGGPALNIIHNGVAPGILTDGEESESDLDVEWSGAVAKGASVDFVVSQTTETSLGINLSALYIVDNNLAPVMSESYGFCELFIGTAGNQFFSSLWQQAAAQGITVMLSSGDGSSAGCDNFNAGGPATLGLQVSGFASTPYNVAVGGTDFNDLTNASTYWSTSNNSTTQASALNYIPETTWDDNCTNPVFGSLLGFSTNAETNCNNSTLISRGFINIIGGSGGRSNCISSDGVNPSSCLGGYPKPSWQIAPGVPSDGVRDVPDVSLYAASGSPSGSFYVICEADAVGGGSSCDPTNPNTNFLGIGGTSASSPAFAGIMALVNQKTGMRQGNANFVLYKLAQQFPSSFHDVTTGTIQVPCQTGTLNCTTNVAGHQYGILSGYTTGTGYDLATGIGSVNVGNLLQNWSSATFRASTTTITLTPNSNLTHGQSVAVSGTVKPSSGSGGPTGNVSLLTSSGVSAGNFTLNNGSISGNTNVLPGGTYTLTAHYAGDATFGGSDSAPLSLTMGKENSSSKVSLVTFDWQGNLISANTTSAVYGSPYLLRVDVLNSAGAICDNGSGLPQFGCPTGSVSLADGNALTGSFPLNSLGYTEDQSIQLPGGSNSVQAQYSGDSSFNASATTATLNITPAATTISSPSNGGTVGANYFANVTIQSVSSGTLPTGTVTFYANGTPIPGTVTYSSWSTNFNPPMVTYQAGFSSSSSPFPVPGNYTLTTSYSGDANYQAATSSGTTINVRFGIPTVNLQSSPNPVNVGASTNLVATVLGGSPTIAPTGTISFFEPLLGLSPLPGTVSYKTVTDPSTGNLDLRGTLTIQPGFTAGYFANYNGDNNYPQGSTCCAAFVTVNGNDFVLSAQQNSATVFAGSSAFYQMVVGLQSNTTPVSFGTNACSGLPAETTCSIAPDPTSNTTIANVRISTTGPHSIPRAKLSSYRLHLFWAGSMLPFAAILLIGCRRSRTKRLSLRLLPTLVLFLGIACGGGGNGGGGGGGTPPPAPSSLTATAASYNEIDLNWIQSTGTGFTVFRSTTSGFTPASANQIANLPPGYAFSYPDGTLAPSTTYYYLVKATNTSGASGSSNQASATTQGLDPGTPAGTYNITVTGTSGSISHSVNLTLVVQ